MRTRLARLGLAAALGLAVMAGAISAAEAGGRGFQGGYGGGRHHGVGRIGYGFAGSYGYGGYGFADAAVNGAYIGAPYTRFPRPNELVSPAWGYGTYGVPTATGIRQAPAADPIVYVIESPAPARRQASRARLLSRAPDGRWIEPAAAPGATAGGARIVTVSTGGR